MPVEARIGTRGVAIPKSNLAGGRSEASGTTLDGRMFNAKTFANAAPNDFGLRIAEDLATARIVSLDLTSDGPGEPLALTLAGIGSTAVDATQVFALASPRAAAPYALRFKRDLNGDSLDRPLSVAPLADSTDPEIEDASISFVSTPEPGVIALCVIGLMLIFRRRRGAGPMRRSDAR